MEILTGSPLDRVLEIHNRIGDLLAKRRNAGLALDVANFPTTDEEYLVWTEFTHPQNKEILAALIKNLPPISKDSKILMQRALDHCVQRNLVQYSTEKVEPLAVVTDMVRSH